MGWLQDSALGQSVIKNTYCQISLLLSHVFVFRVIQGVLDLWISTDFPIVVVFIRVFF